MDASPKKTEVYYDGACALCTAVVGSVARSSKSERFALQDITKDTLPPQITKKAAEREIHVIDGEGRAYKNAEAMLKILEAYPVYKPLVFLGRLPLIKQLLQLGYFVISRNRYWLSK